jgi:hypothetical protein
MNPDPEDEKIRRLHRLRRLLFKADYYQVARDLSTSETCSIGPRPEATTERNLRNLGNLRIVGFGFGMKLVCGLLLFLILAPGAAQAQIGSPSPGVPIADTRHPYEYILLCGGPSLHLWEQYKNEPHDNYWGCFVRAARTRLQELRPVVKDNASATVTMLIYLDGYRSRSVQEKRDLIPLIYSVRDAYQLNLVPIENGEDVIRYLNAGRPRQQMKIADFEYFGHSNQDAFMFDYSNQVGSSSKSWLHQNQLAELHRGIFAGGAYVKSWGCYTGESMSQKFRAATGVPMVGAVGKVDYSNREDALNGIVPVLSSVGGRWTR